MNSCLLQYYRCPERYIRLALKGPLSAKSGYFQFGDGSICYGKYHGGQTAALPTGVLCDASRDTVVEDGTIYLPFDPTEVVENLRRELYVEDWRNGNPSSALAGVYYFLRPFLSVGVRKHLQKFHLRDWDKLQFPKWPVDFSVDQLLGRLLLLLLKSNRVERIPFIWYWPEGASSCAIMTHDLESELGRNMCATLMDMNDAFRIPASFQIIPEERYGVTGEFLNSIRQRGFEIVVHDLNHDGHLYKNREQFLERVARINSYAKEFGAEGFRAGTLYRKQLWYDALKVSYDMSIPNVAHLDPQRGGCCTVMPYFLGEILELPVTATQDYTLFQILNDYSIDLWKRQIALIMENHGLISLIVHPDYMVNARERSVYEALLQHLVRLREEKGVWITTPGELNRWWRERSQMVLVENSGGWHIEGPGKERARIAWASEKEGRLVFTF